jgi:hypothetical protein
MDGCAAGAFARGADLLYMAGAETTRGSFLEGAWFGRRLTRGGAECVAAGVAVGSGSGSGVFACSVRAGL